MSVKEAILELNLLDKPFRAVVLADIMYPDSNTTDTEGRTYNRGVSAVARKLRKTRGIEEIEYGLFYAHREFFTQLNNDKY